MLALVQACKGADCPHASPRRDKGTRGVASKDFDKNDTVDYNRKNNGGLYRDPKTGKKIVTADRNRSPESLGLKQWDGN